MNKKAETVWDSIEDNLPCAMLSLIAICGFLAIATIIFLIQRLFQEIKMETKKIKPYGKVFAHGREYFMLAPYTERDIWSDNTFHFEVVPFFQPEFEYTPVTPRFIVTNEFLIEYSNWDEIKIKVQEETEEQ